MYWEKKICIRLTLKRIVGAVVMVSIVANLLIVGAVLGADSLPVTASATLLSMTSIGIESPFTLTSSASEVPTSTLTMTQTPTVTVTDTLTPTQTSTAPPILTTCVKRLDWPMYRIQRGDTLFALARATGSTVHELVLANCLVSNRIVAGQLLYVLRLPFTPTPTDTLTTFPTEDVPTHFEMENMVCDAPYYASFSVRAYDPEGIQSINVLVYSSQGSLMSEIPMKLIELSYSGETFLQEPYTIANIAYYQFRAVDSFENVTFSQTYSGRSESCFVVTPTTETASGPIG